ncbi:hypothetical protein HQ520_15715, partial [bacterium]|nr:hypothetical protein [bacterium]
MGQDSDKARALIEKTYLNDLPRDAQRSTEDFRGVRIYTTVFWREPEGFDRSLLPPDADAHLGMTQYYYEYAFVDDLCVFLEGQRAFMKKIISNYLGAKSSGSGQSGLAGTSNFRRALGLVAETPDVLAYANVQRWVEKQKERPDLEAGLADNAVLKMEEILSAVLGLRFAPDGLRSEIGVFTMPSPQGLAGVLAQESRGGFRSERRAPADSVSFSALLLDLQKVYRLLIAAVGDPGASGEPSGVERFFQDLATKTGVDVERELVTALGNEVAWYTYPAGNGGGQDDLANVFLLGLKQEAGFAEKLARTIDGLREITGLPFQVLSDSFQGFEVYRVESTGGPAEMTQAQRTDLSFAAAGNFLILSKDANQVKDVVRGLERQNGDGLAGNEKYGRAVAGLEPGHIGLGWADSEKEMLHLLNQAGWRQVMWLLTRQWLNMSAMPESEEMANYFDQTLSSAYNRPQGLLFRLFISYPERFRTR